MNNAESDGDHYEEARQMKPVQANLDAKPTQRLDQGVPARRKDVKPELYADNLPRMPIGIPSVSQTRRTERIEMHGENQEICQEKIPGDLQVSGSRNGDNRSYSINSFTNPKIRQTVNEVQMNKNYAYGGETDEENHHENNFVETGEVEDDGNRAEANFNLVPSHHQVGYTSNTHQGVAKAYQESSYDEEEDEDEILQPSLNPSGTFGKPRAVVVEESSDGFKLPSQQSLTKDRIRKLLSESSKTSNKVDLVIGGPAPTTAKQTAAKGHKKAESSSKRSLSQSKKGIMPNGAPVIGINLSSSRKRTSVSSTKNVSKGRTNELIHPKSQNQGLVMKQKDFGAFAQSSPLVADDYYQLKHREDDQRPKRSEDFGVLSEARTYSQPTDHFDQRATAEFVLPGNKPDVRSSRRSGNQARSDQLEFDSSNQDARSEMRESKGYYEIEMQRVKKKRENSAGYRSRDTSLFMKKMDHASRNSVSSASKVSSQHIEKLYRHAFAKKEIQSKIKEELDRQKEEEDDRACSFKPIINANSKKMNMPIDYSMNSYKSLLRGRPASADSRQSDSKSQKSDRPLSIKSDIGPSNHSSSKLTSNTLVLTIRKSDIEQEIADLQKTNLQHMFFKKKGATKLAANTTQEHLRVQPQRQPVKPSLKSFGKFSATQGGCQPVRGDPNVFKEISKIMRENDAMASVSPSMIARSSNRVSAISEDDRQSSAPRLKTLD